MFAYYRGLSFVAVLSLLTSAALTYTIMCLLGKAIGFALNLLGGLRRHRRHRYHRRLVHRVLRENQGRATGRPVAPASTVARGWPRARRTILVSDFVSFLAAAVLYVVTVGKVQGFAFTLGLTTLLDVAVVFLFTKPLMTLLARRPFYAQGHRWSGLDPKSLGVHAPLRRVRRQTSSETKEA